LGHQKAFACRDLQAIVGAKRTISNFVVAGLLSGFIDIEPPTWFSDIANNYLSLREYVDRVEDEIGVHGN
jgi:hypothetical protein